jgi:hypothetical protein
MGVGRGSLLPSGERIAGSRVAAAPEIWGKRRGDRGRMDLGILKKCEGLCVNCTGGEILKRIRRRRRVDDDAFVLPFL